MIATSIKTSVFKRLATWTETRVSYDWLTAVAYQPFGNEPFIRPGIFMSYTRHATMTASGLTEAHGVVFTQIYFPKDWAGGLDIYQVAENWGSLFRRKRDGQIWYREPRVDQATFQSDDRYHCLEVSIPFIALIRPMPGQLEGFERMHFTQANSFSVLDAIYRSSTGWALAQGGSTSSLADAVVSAVEGDDFVAIHSGFLESGSTFSAGDVLWLSTASAGTLTNSEPTASPKQRVGKVVDSGTLLINIERVTST